MLSIRTLRHIATSRTIPSFRACRSQNGSHYSALTDQGRIEQGQGRVLTEEARRQWLNQHWQQRR
ncbi:hypothetical protein [Nodosilinea sp. P-1105]|uniref:hypothetical protein n=1 Tax=Nodosilinea sp. P-1105 TaxID=2546229 RepID=UPI00146F7818|nr:hypothetical protein [Nodosilinea sp. P-1105]NMF86459.1 hypothetical protein [Nodosilinea sp. P-1105]